MENQSVWVAVDEEGLILGVFSRCAYAMNAVRDAMVEPEDEDYDWCPGDDVLRSEGLHHTITLKSMEIDGKITAYEE